MAKGGSFEREVASRLSLWWSGGERDDVFYRSHGSGGRATSRGKRGKATAGQYGDICASDPSGVPFLKWVTVECKKGYSRLGLQDLIDCVKGRKGGNKGENWYDWITKVEKEARLAGSLGWMIVTRRTGRAIMVVVPSVLCFDPLTANSKMTIRWNCTSLVAMPLDEFTRIANPKCVIKEMRDRP